MGLTYLALDNKFNESFPVMGLYTLTYNRQGFVIYLRNKHIKFFKKYNEKRNYIKNEETSI